MNNVLYESVSIGPFTSTRESFDPLPTYSIQIYLSKFETLAITYNKTWPLNTKTNDNKTQILSIYL